MVFLLRLALFAAFFAIAPVPARAAGEPLIFKKIPSDLRVRQIAGFLQDSGALPADRPTEIAPVDLNHDGVDEYVFRQINPSCEAASSCIYLIAGISARQPVLLASLKARKIGISGQKSYGVKNILVYNQKQNDFQYITHKWNPFTSSFEAH